MSEKKEEKIGMKRLVSNVFYVMKYALRHDRYMALSYIISRCIFFGVGTFTNTFLLKQIIDIFTTTADMESVIKVLAVMFVLEVVRFVIFRYYENFFWTRMVGFSGTIQRELMAKAQMMDLKYYEKEHIPIYPKDIFLDGYASFVRHAFGRIIRVDRRLKGGKNALSDHSFRVRSELSAMIVYILIGVPCIPSA